MVDDEVNHEHDLGRIMNVKNVGIKRYGKMS